MVRVWAWAKGQISVVWHAARNGKHILVAFLENPRDLHCSFFARAGDAAELAEPVFNAVGFAGQKGLVAGPVRVKMHLYRGLWMCAAFDRDRVYIVVCCGHGQPVLAAAFAAASAVFNVTSCLAERKPRRICHTVAVMHIVAPDFNLQRFALGGGARKQDFGLCRAGAECGQQQSG